MDIKRMMEIQLQSRLQRCNQETLALPEALLTREYNLKLEQPLTWLGKLPVSYGELSKTVGSILKRSESSHFASSIPQTGGTNSILKDMSDALENSETQNNMNEMYSLLLQKLENDKIPIESLTVVTVVCAGGIPFSFYGLHPSKSIEECAANHFKLAQHGILLDLIPLTFGDFSSNLLKMGVAVASILVGKLKQRDNKRSRVDAIMFACKGTLPVSLCLDEYTSNHPQNSIALVGFGTDLLQGFIPENDEDPVGAVKLFETAQWARFLVFNTIYDTAVGAGRASLDKFIASLNSPNGEKNEVCWLDSFPDMDHNWYDTVLASSPSEGDIGSSLKEICAKIRTKTLCK